MESNDTGQKNRDQVDHDAEDKAALERNAELCGLPYESGLFNKDPDWTNKMISCAQVKNTDKFLCWTIHILNSSQTQKNFLMVKVDFYLNEKNL